MNIALNSRILSSISLNLGHVFGSNFGTSSPLMFFRYLNKIRYADDDKISVRQLFLMRLPSLLVGLVLGILLSFVTSRFEQALSSNIEIVFFIPFVIYMADAVGTQTQNIYARDLRTGRASFKSYFLKEGLLGLVFGTLSGIIIGPIVYFWFGSLTLALAVSLAMFGAVALAPLVALLVTEFLALEHTDPAVGAGPIATVLQDTLSVLIYGVIVSLVVL